MSNLYQLILDQEEKKRHQSAKIKGPKSVGTTDDDEGRRGLHRHHEEDEDGRVENVEDDGFRDDRRAV